MKKHKVVVICGPTASGKTSLSIELAKAHLPIENKTKANKVIKKVLKIFFI